jgi:hypothetical protein
LALGGIEIPVMIKGVGTKMLAVGIKGGSRAAAVPQKAFRGFAQIASAQYWNDVLRNIISQVCDNYGHPINYGIFAQTLLVGANQYALYDRIMGLLGDRSEVKRRVASPGLPATGANGLKFFEMD